MFNVDGTNITLSRGDTGALRLTANVTRRDTGAAYTFGERDRAVFSIKAGNGQLVKQKSYPLVENKFTVIFLNQDTDNLNPGGYSWDVRYVINPYYNTDPPEGPWPDYSELEFPIASGTKCMHLGGCYIANTNISAEEAWTSAHWTAAWPSYADLTFPVASGTKCMHEGTYYMSNQAIETSEDWTPAHWNFMDYRIPVDGDQVITPNTPMSMNLLTVVGEI